MSKSIKRERFVKIAENRTNKIISMIRLLGNCSNKNNYEYTQKDIDKIFEAIKLELNDAQNRFLHNDKKNQKFKLK